MELSLLRGGHRLFGGPFILLAIVVIAVVALTSRARARRSTAASGSVAVQDKMSGSPAERVLSERFARGEIDLAEYRARLVALRESAVVEREPPTPN